MQQRQDKLWWFRSLARCRRFFTLIVHTHPSLVRTLKIQRRNIIVNCVVPYKIKKMQFLTRFTKAWKRSMCLRLERRKNQTETLDSLVGQS